MNNDSTFFGEINKKNSTRKITIVSRTTTYKKHNLNSSTLTHRSRYEQAPGSE